MKKKTTKLIEWPNTFYKTSSTNLLIDEHEQIVYDFDVFLTKAKEMSYQDPPDIVIFSNLIWGAADVCLRKFFLARFQLKISSKNAQEKLMEIVLDASTDDAILCERLHGAWTYAKHCRKNAYAMRYMHQPLRKEILQSVANKNAQEKLMKIVLDGRRHSLYDAIRGRLHGDWTYATSCRMYKYAMRPIEKPQREEILCVVGDMQTLIDKADIEKIRNKLEASDLQILELSKKYSMTIGKDQFSYDKVTC